MVYTYKPVTPLLAQRHLVVVVDYLVFVLPTNYSLNILIFNNPQNPIFANFQKFLTSPNSYTLKTFEKLSKNAPNIIEPRNADQWSLFSTK